MNVENSIELFKKVEYYTDEASIHDVRG